MNQVQSIERLNQRELEAGISIEASWHNEYKDSAYIFFGSLPFELTEGDILIVFSQYGIPVHLKLVRDKETGKSRGFGYLKYEDQRSTILAVDNLNGTKILGRIIRVNHTFYEERERDEEYEKLLLEELKNDFAEPEEEPEVENDNSKRNMADDPFQDPLLLMKNSDLIEPPKKRSRSHRDNHDDERDGKGSSRKHREKEPGKEESKDRRHRSHHHRSHRHSRRDSKEKRSEKRKEDKEDKEDHNESTKNSND